MRHPHPFHRLSITLALALSVPLTGCAPEISEPSTELLGPGEDIAPWHPSVVRARRTAIDRDVTDETADELHLRLFDDTAVQASLTHLGHSELAGTWRGTVAGDPTGEVALSVADGTYAGTVRTGSRLFQIFADPEGEHLVIERDETAIEPEAPIPEPELPQGQPLANPSLANPSLAPPAAADGAATNVDLLVVYTPSALAGAGGEAGMDAIIALALEETNAGYAASDVDVELRLAHRALVPYDESGFDWGNTLSRLRGNGDGFMDEVHALRDAHGADHVVLLVDTVGPYAGIGYQLMNGTESFFDAWAFSVVARDYATGAYTFGHELGHNMGAHHDHDNASSPGYYPDSHGLQVPSHGLRTIMAYYCDGCARINHWSNPDVSVVGAPTGLSDWANNARTLRQTAPLTAAFRPSKLGPVPQAAALQTPADGTSLPGTAVTFTWNDSGATAYRLQLGTPDDPTRYHDAITAETTATVAGLPHDGSPLRARLWSGLGEQWVATEASYQAYAAPSGTPVVTYPLAGSVLPSGPVAVRWSYHPAALSHRLTVLDDEGEQHAAAETSGQATTLPPLPCDAGLMHLTLFTELPDGTVESAATHPSASCDD